MTFSLTIYLDTVLLTDYIFDVSPSTNPIVSHTGEESYICGTLTVGIDFGVRREGSDQTLKSTLLGSCSLPKY